MPYLVSQIGKLQTILGLSFAFILVWFNYATETKKWQILLNQRQFSFAMHFRALLSGSAISLFLPFRTGEYLGRILHFPKNKWSLVILSSIRSGLFQLATTLILGTICLLFVNSQSIVMLSKSQLLLISLLSFVLLILLIIKLELILTWVLNLIRLKLQSSKAEVPYRNALSLSFLRYGIFLAQYALLFWAFGISNIATVLLWVPVYLLFQTIVPTFFLTEIGIRAAFAIHIFQDVNALIPIFIIFMINILIPAAVGAFFIRGKSK